eukprot:TRINITY_DN5212_c0_g1_i5.p1 TRINITY_DN5212_c0_g1~~TRINITY_DN5212_c0_g1_i5.p1  ORF type:complete len:168 (+),score=11.12 TRINITY_DN5212_c0_g1_i5:62-565(+)
MSGTPVYQLQCSSCGRNLCDRGVSVSLVADNNIKLFSTDFVTKFVSETGPAYKIKTCSCQVRDFSCKYCLVTVGYHVVGPCRFCLSSAHNCHYWMFHKKGVTANVRINDDGSVMDWDSLPAFPTEKTTIFVNSENDLLSCPICYSILKKPSVLPCGKKFRKIVFPPI